MEFPSNLTCLIMQFVKLKYSSDIICYGFIAPLYGHLHCFGNHAIFEVNFIPSCTQ